LVEILKYLSVYLISMVKFFGGPLAGISLGLSFFETVLFTVAGMMTSVVVFSMLGSAFSKWYTAWRRKKRATVFNTKNRRIVKIWRKFGLTGIAFLTPVIFTPIVGTIVAALFGAPRRQIFVQMLWSAVFWGATLTLFVFKFKHLATSLF
jgi:uncharacterized membrane protein